MNRHFYEGVLFKEASRKLGPGMVHFEETAPRRGFERTIRGSALTERKQWILFYEGDFPLGMPEWAFRNRRWSVRRAKKWARRLTKESVRQSRLVGGAG